MSQIVDVESPPLDNPQAVLSHPDALYEVVDGKVVELPEMGAFAYLIANHLARALSSFLAETPLGAAVVEVVFVIDDGRNLRRRPDVAFVSYGRWPTDRELPEGDWNVVPDLAVEVVSPNDRGDELLRKIRDYFEAGVRLVWVLYPAVRQVYVYAGPKAVRILAEDEVLDGGDVLPGLRLPVGPLFRRTI